MKIFDEKLTKIDYITLGFILLQTFILILNWNYLPTAELDTPYHLLMGKMFADYDRIMLWDYYEYAPIGRPHLYPPLEHILLWFIHDITGADWWNIGRFISLIQYPLPLFTVWFFCKKVFNPITALASVVFLSVSYQFWFWQVSVAPTALILSLFPLFLYSFYRKKVFTSIILLSSFLYLHLGLPYVVILSVFIFSLFSLYQTRVYLRQFAVVTGCSALIFLPWIIHILMYRDWLRSSPHGFFDPLSLISFNILTAAFFVVGLFTCLKKAKIDLKYLLVLSTFVGFLAIALYGFRYETHSPIINCVVAGIGFEVVYTKIVTKTTLTSRKKVAAGLLLLLIPLGAFSVALASSMPSQGRPQKPPPGQQPPQLPQQPGQRQNQPIQLPPGQQPLQQPGQRQPQPPKQPIATPSRIRIQPSPLLEMITSLKTGKRPPRMWQISNPEIDELIQWIITNTSEDEILHLNNGMLADYLALFTGRRTDSGMYREVTSSELFGAIQKGEKSGIFIMEKERFAGQGLPPGMAMLGEFGNLLLLQGAKPERIPHEVPFHLKDLFVLLERPEPQIITRWITIITDVRPRTVYIGVRQKDIKNPELQRLIDELTPICEVRLGVIVEDQTMQNIVLPSGITSIRLMMPQDKISFTFIESVRNSLDSKINLEIAVLGSPISENRKTVETLLQVLPLVDRIVRHVPPNVEFIRITQKEHQLFGEKFVLQIDTYRGEFEVTPEELYMLLQAAHQITEKIIIEFKYPPATPELLDFLRKVYAV